MKSTRILALLLCIVMMVNPIYAGAVSDSYAISAEETEENVQSDADESGDNSSSAAEENENNDSSIQGDDVQSNLDEQSSEDNEENAQSG
ncbi:MAG: hypothetical protein K6F84_05180, partial [Lachnospiraceae bacterium]|nr:hypothetical protein [Lachnospiraceae bacterium]